VLANITAIAQAIQAFDGSQVVAGSIQAAAMAASINPNTIMHDTISPFVQSGLVWSTVSGLQGTMSGGTIYVGTSSAYYRVIVNGIGSYTFTASKDTYIDIDYNGNVYYSAVANGAAAPSLTANSLRVAKVVSSTSFLTVTQTGYDSLNNLIYPTSPNQNAGKLDIGTYTNTGNGGGTGYYINLGGIKLCWGVTGTFSNSGPATNTLSLPSSFFTTVQAPIVNGYNTNIVWAVNAYTTSTVTYFINNTTSSAQAIWFVIGT
jgi:hypothetical protein